MQGASIVHLKKWFDLASHIREPLAVRVRASEYLPKYYRLGGHGLIPGF
jgi:hypothetical protein